MTPFDVFASADKDFVICCGNDHLFAQLCKIIERPDLVTDDRFLSNQHRTDNNAALKFELEVALKKQPAAH